MRKSSWSSLISSQGSCIFANFLRTRPPSLHRSGFAESSAIMSTTRLRVSSSAAVIKSARTRRNVREERPRLLPYDEIPEWYQENEHILHGYRPVSGSVKTSFSSWKYIHNETINIYSHLLPAVAFVLGIWYISQYLHSRYAEVTIADEFIFVFFLFTAAVCLGFSTTYHTLLNHSLALETIWLRLDFVGIVFLTLGDFVSGIYVAFWCEPLLRKIYWAMVSCC